MPSMVSRLKEHREAAGLSQAELAEAVGVRRETVARLEAGRYNPSLKLAMDLAERLGVTVYDLFSFQESC